jgi:hypothetical protein
MILRSGLILLHCFSQFTGWPVALNNFFFFFFQFACIDQTFHLYFISAGRRIIYVLKEFKVDKIAVSVLRLKIGVLKIAVCNTWKHET